MWIRYQPNPCGRSVGDCSVRAISKALGTDWETAYTILAGAGYDLCDIMNSNSVIGSVLRKHGFIQKNIPNSCPDCYTFGDFCKDHPKGVYVLCTGNHVATVIGGDLYDAWNSLNEIVLFYWYL